MLFTRLAAVYVLLGWASLAQAADINAAKSHELSLDMNPWYVASSEAKACYLISEAFDGATTPEGVVLWFRNGHKYYVIRRNSEFMVGLQNMNDINNVVVLIKGKRFCDFSVKTLSN